MEKKEKKLNQNVVKLMKQIQNAVSLEAYQLYSPNSQKKEFITHTPQEKEHSPTFIELQQKQKVKRKQLREILSEEKYAKRDHKKIQLSLPKDDNELKQLTIKYRQFKRNLQKKTKLIEKEEILYKDKIRKFEEEKMKATTLQRRNIIQKKLSSMEERRKLKIEEHEREKQYLRKMGKKKLYQKMLEDYDQKYLSMRNEQQRKYEERKKKYAVNMQDIKKFESLHDSQLQQKLEARTVRLQQSRMMIPELNAYRSKFYEQTLEQQLQIKRNYEQKLLRPHEINKRQKQYQDLVKQEYIPKSNPKKAFTPPPRTLIKETLNKEELKKIGDKFQNQAKKRMKRKTCGSSIDRNKENLLSTSKLYQNYLPEILKNIPPNRISMQQKTIKRVKAIMTSKNLSKHQKLEEASFLSKGLEYNLGNNVSSDEKNIKTLQMKMEILLQLSD